MCTHDEEHVHFCGKGTTLHTHPFPPTCSSFALENLDIDIYIYIYIYIYIRRFLHSERFQSGSRDVLMRPPTYTSPRRGMERRGSIPWADQKSVLFKHNLCQV